MAKELTDSNYSEVIAQDSLVVIDFWAQWCGPCKKIGPIVEEVAEQYEGVVDIRKCDVEENTETSEKYGIISIPNILFIKNGEVVDRHVGTIKKDQLIALVEKNK